jgi:hypothetical protein
MSRRMGDRLMKASRVARRSVGLLAVALLMARSAGAQVPAVETPLQGFLDALGNAVAQVLGYNDAAAELSAAGTILAQLETVVQDPDARASLGKDAKRLERAIAGLGRAFGRAQVTVDNPNRSTTKKLKALKTVYAKSLKLASRLAPPVIAEVAARSAGFHRPGDEVIFRVLAADGSACNEVPTVAVENQFASTAVDLGTVSANADATITLTMGEGAGGARITVTACGRSTTRLLFNYGPRAGRGIPRNLPTGTYELSYSARGYIDIPETSLGVFPMVDAAAFAQQLRSVFDGVAGSYDVPGCSQSVRYSRFDGRQFTVTFSATCSAGGVTATQRIRFTIRRVG